jgi:dolichol-phosphate mannosyltransferase
MTAKRPGRRWLKFNAVGAVGAAAQLAALGIFHGLLRLDYLTATALAVEAAALHNFVWHERWTWRDCTDPGGGVLTRLLRFNLSAGLVSILTNLASMRWLVGTHHAQYLMANLVSIAAGSVANFFLSDLFVFRSSERVRLD